MSRDIPKIAKYPQRQLTAARAQQYLIVVVSTVVNNVVPATVNS